MPNGYKLKRIMIHDNGIEKQVRPKTRNPWANTLLYMPLEWDLIDKVSWESWTGYWTQTYVTLDSWIQVYHWNSSHYAETPVVAMNTAFTLNVWLKRNSSSWEPMVRNDNSGFRNFYQVAFSNTDMSDGRYYNWTYYGITQAIDTNWHNHVLVCDSWGVKVYLDKNNIYTNSNIPSLVWKTQRWGIWFDQSGGGASWDAYYSNIIMENKGWDISEISDYYDQTKANYWL